MQVVTILKKRPKPSTTAYPTPTLNGAVPPKKDDWPMNSENGGVRLSFRPKKSPCVMLDDMVDDDLVGIQKTTQAYSVLLKGLALAKPPKEIMEGEKNEDAGASKKKSSCD
jgi:hypothetical protein